MKATLFLMELAQGCENCYQAVPAASGECADVVEQLNDLAALRSLCEAVESAALSWQTRAEMAESKLRDCESCIYRDTSEAVTAERDALKAKVEEMLARLINVTAKYDDTTDRAEKAESKLARVREWCDSTEQECLDTVGAECSVEGRCGIMDKCVVPEIRAIIDEEPKDDVPHYTTTTDLAADRLIMSGPDDDEEPT